MVGCADMGVEETQVDEAIGPLVRPVGFWVDRLPRLMPFFQLRFLAVVLLLDAVYLVLVAFGALRWLTDGVTSFWYVLVPGFVLLWFGGWYFTYSLWDGYAKRINEQLRRRVGFPGALWGSPARAATAKDFARRLAGEMGWVNHHFMPEDPLVLLVENPAEDPGGDCLLRVLFELERERQVRLVRAMPAGLCREGLCFGEIVDFVCQRVAEGPVVGVEDLAGRREEVVERWSWMRWVGVWVGMVMAGSAGAVAGAAWVLGWPLSEPNWRFACAVGAVCGGVGGAVLLWNIRRCRTGGLRWAGVVTGMGLIGVGTGWAVMVFTSAKAGV